MHGSSRPHEHLYSGEPTMKSIPWRVFFRFIPVLFALNLAGCSIFMMSPQEEIELGGQVRKQIEPKIVLVSDPGVHTYVDNLGRRLWSKTPQGPVPPHFHVIRDKELNAFAIPGGDVYVHTGVIQAADDEAELAGVIAHELGHVSCRHGAQAVSRQQGASLFTALLGGAAGPSAQLAGQLLSSGVMFNYSRSEETEADNIAVGTLDALGYDPMAMHAFFKKIKDKYGDQSMPVLNLFASHPPTADRMRNVQDLAAKLPIKERARPTEELNRIKKRL